jgi:hypothetical protein
LSSFNATYQQLTLLLSLAEARFDALQLTTKAKVATGENLAIYMALIFFFSDFYCRGDYSCDVTPFNYGQ